MKVFLSWSGERSKLVAAALKDWLPMVLQNVEPWMSEKDILAGERWAEEIGKELEASHFGVICLTRENSGSPWLMFEAGAVSKRLEKGAVVPYIIDPGPISPTGPLGQFQGKRADRPHTLELMRSLNARSEPNLPDHRLVTQFDALWPNLEARLTAVPASVAAAAPQIDVGAVLTDLVEVVRGLDRRINGIESGLARLSGSIRQGIARGPSRTHGSEPPHVTTVSADPFSDVGKKVWRGSPEHILRKIAAFLGRPVAEFGDGWWLRDDINQRTYADVEALRQAMERDGDLTVVIEDSVG